MSSASPRSDHGIAPGLPAPRRFGAVACVLSALVLVVLDAAIANVALPAIARSLAVTAADSVRVVSAYQLALVMALLPCAALGESFGYRRVYTLGVALFVGASALCALAPSLSFLVAARLLQGLGGAAIMSLGVALLRLVLPERQLGMAIGWNALAVALSSAAGPTVGALVLSRASWPWLFAINVPLGSLVMIATRALPAVAGTGRALDVVSMVMHVSAFGMLIMGAELTSTRPFPAVALIVVGALFLTELVRREMSREAPLIPLDLLRAGSFRVSVLASFCCFAGQSAAMVALPFYLQQGLGLSVLQTGLSITPWPLSVAVVAPIAGRLTGRIAGGWLCAIGGVLLAVGLACTSLWPAHGQPLVLTPFLILCGAGFGLFQVPNNRNMLLSAPAARAGAAGGMQGTARLTGQTVGAVIMTLLFTTSSPEHAPRIGLAVAAVLALLAGLISTLRGRSDVRHR